jgi:hypothetical protein
MTDESKSEIFINLNNLLPNPNEFSDIIPQQEILERWQDNPDKVQDLFDRYRAAAKFIRHLSQHCSIYGYEIVGSSSDGENMRVGKFKQKPASWVDMKEHYPSDIDMVVCVDGDDEYIQRQAEMLARGLMMSLGYFIHVFVYSPDTLQEVVKKERENSWYKGAILLWNKLANRTK